MLRNAASSILVSALCFLAFSRSAFAEDVTLNYVYRGWMADLPQGVLPAPLSYLAGGLSYSPPARNFFTFDLSRITEPITSATLALYVPPNGYQSADPYENYYLVDVETPITRPLPYDSYTYFDLGSGVFYGLRQMTADDDGKIVEIGLDYSAIYDLNHSHSLFTIGGFIPTLDSLSNNEYTFFATGNPTYVTELRLTVAPEPASAALVAFAAMIFGVRRSRNRSS